jgi:hypothetical protein
MLGELYDKRTENREKRTKEDLGMQDFVETRIISAVREFLTGRVNELLEESRCHVPVIEFGEYSGVSGVATEITLSTCERSEKERIVFLDAYSLNITFSFSDVPESELHCYAYAAAVQMALWENMTLGGIADRAVVTSKKYCKPKKQHCGEGWGVVISLRITLEAVK